VIESVGRVTRVMDEIHHATQEQSRGIGQVNQAVVHIDDITQQNAALVEQAAAAAGSLARQAEWVAQAIAVFKLKEIAARSAAPPRKVPALQ
jgi:aerotaxis receptor